MTEFFTRLKQRKLVQWALAYGAFSFALIQVLDVVAGSYGWPRTAMHIVFGLLVLGFVVTLILAWYHGERGAQRISGPELLLIALVLAVGGGLLWHFARPAVSPAAVAGMARSYNSAACRSGPCPRPADDLQNQSAAAGTGAAVAASPMVAQAIPAKSVAVLPFENLSADKGNAYFADGMQDLILTKLADIGDLRVISRTSTLQYGSHPKNLKTVGQQLGVASILEGSVQKAGNQVLINVQLIDAKTDSHIWAQSYTRTLDNIFGVEGEVAGKVAEALKAKLTAAESETIAKIPTHNKQAYQAFLKANYYLDDSNRTNDAGELAKSIVLYKQAVAADPNFADAWVGLALGYQKIGDQGPDAEKAVQHALAIDPNNGAAHSIHAFVLVDRREFDQAIAEVLEGARLSPKRSGSSAAVGFVYQAAGRLDEADAAFAHCTALFPRWNFCRKSMADVEMMQRRYAAARETLQYVVDHDPADIVAATALASAYELERGDLAAARKALQNVPTPPPSSGQLSDAWYWLDMYARDYSAALAVIQRAPMAWFQQQNLPLALYQARVYRAQGKTDQAGQAFTQARATLEAGIRQAPQAAALHASLALALAGLGDGKGAVAEAQRAIKLANVLSGNQDQYLLNLAMVEAWSGNTAATVKLLDQLLGKPAGDVVSVSLLKLDPVWDPIRHDPRFQALLKKYGKQQPATSGSVAFIAAPNATL